MNVIITFISQFLAQPVILISLIALIGLSLQKKGLSNIISGTIKAGIGVAIIGGGAAMLNNSLPFISEVLSHRIGINGYLPTTEALLAPALDKYGNTAMFVMIGAFIFNIFLAKFTPFKFIFLTGHIMLYLALFFTMILMNIAKLTPIYTIIFGTIMLGLYFTFMPALTYRFMKNFAEGSMAIGHTSDVGILITGYLAKFFKNNKKDIDNVNLPKGFDIFGNPIVGMTLTMVPLYIIVTLVGGYEYVYENYSKPLFPIVYSILQSLIAAAGVGVVLYGVQMMLDELIPAFKGVSDKLVPGVVPALDCSVIFKFGKSSIIIGFISMFLGTLIGLFLQLFVFRTENIILPGLLPCFFAGGATGVIGNNVGGIKGAIFGPIVTGLILTIGTGYLAYFTDPELLATGATFGDPSYASIGLITGYILKIIHSIIP
jgi:PTS system ascorbate-specific IIC component